MRPLPHRQRAESRERDEFVRVRLPGEHQDLADDEAWIAVQDF